MSPNLVEALALRWCLQWILTTNQEGKFIIESDSEVVVNYLKGRNHLVDLDNVILDCNDFLSKLPNCNVVSVKRSKNVVAHCLVGMAKQFGSYSWMDMSLNLQLY